MAICGQTNGCRPARGQDDAWQAFALVQNDDIIEFV